MTTEREASRAVRCRGITAAGRPCKRRAGDGGFCRQHGAGTFYARVLSAEDRERYADALAQEGLGGEVALLRLHLLHLISCDDVAAAAEIPRTIHALVRALKDDRARGEHLLAALDAAVRDEGRRLLAEQGERWAEE